VTCPQKENRQTWVTAETELAAVRFVRFIPPIVGPTPIRGMWPRASARHLSSCTGQVLQNARWPNHSHNSKKLYSLPRAGVGKAPSKALLLAAPFRYIIGLAKLIYGSCSDGHCCAAVLPTGWLAERI